MYTCMYIVIIVCIYVVCLLVSKYGGEAGVCYSAQGGQVPATHLGGDTYVGRDGSPISHTPQGVTCRTHMYSMCACVDGRGMGMGRAADTSRLYV